MTNIGIDIGKPDGDYTAMTIHCDCGRMWSIDWPAVFTVKIISLDCTCGRRTPINQPAETEAKQ